MKKILYFLLIATVIVACGTANKTAKTETDSNDIIAVYKDCTVYAGSTDYYFANEKGEQIEFRLLNTAGMAEEEIADMEGLTDANVKFEKPMIDPNHKLEGPPGANPAMVGKKFLLIYNEKGVLTEVKLKNKFNLKI